MSANMSSVKPLVEPGTAVAPEVVPAESKLSWLQLPSFAPLNARADRMACRGCGRKSKYFCPQCKVFMGDIIDGTVPRIDLPIDLHIMHHPKEKLAKSTAVHAAVLAPNTTYFHEFPDIPRFDAGDTLLVYPDPAAPTLDDLAAAGKLANYTRVVFVDAQWRQSRAVMRHANLQDLPRVRMNSYETLFWRYQPGMDATYLATIEAIYYFYREYARAAADDGSYDGRYDGLMYLFAHQYELIQGVYNSTGARFGHIPSFPRIAQNAAADQPVDKPADKHVDTPADKPAE
ncbi:DTW domain-containing protein 1 [Thecamonas trahens ATCC 50062]|uniref:tRNA-uridine aminocarboxypropyltransferase 1 n=1 Tax=Thecamonas trahens ATCC 50062 TaxID=461836 RepID=A0A0L0DRL4_THETB|nr:DTW domain-containing protein 1 [Thecamonas trahens ATCC 50062]KNC54974.1 DTW domain-containing protein 1 [Thecamonas trahens ATCC 50062]|eukprot:XP_013753421.1 DTW domain-containing protein 1 [Thecamonas trahens ATCC 50062]